jgi:hypothetical protein
MKGPTPRHRRSIALVPSAKMSADQIAKAKGISVTRAIEDAVALYSRCLKAEELGHARMVGLQIILQTPDGSVDTVRVMV